MATQATKPTQDNNTVSVSTISMQFSDSKIPEFKKVSGKPYVAYGEDNNYPDYLLYLFNKSAKHNAIVGGKAKYIFGGGIKADNEAAAKAWFENFNRVDSMEDVVKKSSLDNEIFGGFRWQIIFNQVGKIQEIYHLDFHKVRNNKDRTEFYYKKDWADRNEEMKVFPAFDPKKPKTAIFAFDEYRPGSGVYPLPGYIGSNNWIESDIEVSKHTLTNAKTGFTPSKFINFYNGEPEENKKKEITRRFENRNTGSEGKKIIIAFNNDPAKKPTIDDLGTSDLTKEDFQAVDNLISSNIYAGHQITSPMLFGIKQEGQLGGATELRIAYDIFKNTYVKNKQLQIEAVLNQFAEYKGIQAKFSFIQADPVGIQINDAIINDALSRDEKREMLGKDPEEKVRQSGLNETIVTLSPLLANKVTESMTTNEIRSIVGLPPLPNGDTLPASSGGGTTPATSGVTPVATESDQPGRDPINENVKNLTGKQHQQLLRIIRQYSKGQITEEVARTLLKTSLGLSDPEIDSLLGIEAEGNEYSKDFTEEEAADMFGECGEERTGFEVLKSKEVNFTSDKECLETELKFFQEKLFFDETVTESPSVIDRIRKKFPTFQIRYSYEPRPGLDAIIPTTRPFCRKLIKLDRFYSRVDIEKISERLGYSVWDRRGGFWDKKPSCRHIWKMHVVIKK